MLILNQLFQSSILNLPPCFNFHCGKKWWACCFTDSHITGQIHLKIHYTIPVSGVLLSVLGGVDRFMCLCYQRMDYLWIICRVFRLSQSHRGVCVKNLFRIVAFTDRPAVPTLRVWFQFLFPSIWPFLCPHSLLNAELMKWSSLVCLY